MSLLSDSKNTIVILRSIHKTALTAPWESLPNKFQGCSSPRSEYAFVLFCWCITKIEHLYGIQEQNSVRTNAIVPESVYSAVESALGLKNSTCWRASLTMSEVDELTLLWVSKPVRIKVSNTTIKIKQSTRGYQFNLYPMIS